MSKLFAKVITRQQNMSLAGKELKHNSCMGFRYAKLFEAAKPCSNHEIHVLFEHGFYLKRPKLGTDLYA